MNKKTLFLFAFVLLAIVSSAAQSPNRADYFQFEPATGISLAGMDRVPAGQNGFVSTYGDCFIDGSGHEIRFLGTNINLANSFPSHEESDRIAEELAGFGINIVRLNYADHIIPEHGYPVHNSFIEPVQLELFDYLFAKLKERGIYIFLRLNISEKFRQANGIEYAGRLPARKCGVDNVDWNMIQLQKRFHREILEHVNPYTGIAYRDDPAICMMSLAQEDSIVNAWYSPQNKFPYLTEPYKSAILERWNTWLKAKYHDTDHLKEAWLADTRGNAEEFIRKGVVNDVQASKSSAASWSLVAAGKKDRIKGKNFVEVRIEKSTKDKSFPKFQCNGIRLERGKPYCLRLKIKADRPITLTLRMGQAEKPWRAAGLTVNAECSTTWKELVLNFYSTIEDGNARLDIYGFEPGSTVDIADISLKSGMDITWPKEESLESQTVEWPYPDNRQIPRQKELDFAEFLSTLETDYFTDLKVNVKSRIGARQPLSGTQLSFGYNYIQAQMDFCDIHSVWNNKQDAMVNSKDCPASPLVQAARSRILGKPMTVSEFHIPDSNPYCAEGLLELSAMAAFQNWSGIMLKSWRNGGSIHPAKLAHMPACYAIYLRRDVKKGSQALIYSTPSSTEEDMKTVAREQNAAGHNFIFSPLLKSMPLALPAGRTIRERPDLFPTEGRTIISTESATPQTMRNAFNSKLIHNSTGEITWDWQLDKAGVFMIDTRNTKVFSGFVRGRNFTYRGMRLSPGKTALDWLTLSLTLSEPFGKSRPGNILRPGRYLLAVTGDVFDNGEGATLCEGVEAELGFAGIGGRTRCFALDPHGNRTREIVVTTNDSGEAVLNIGPEYQTLWYEVIVDQKTE